jgi:hypothetical protein
MIEHEEWQFIHALVLLTYYIHLISNSAFISIQLIHRLSLRLALRRAKENQILNQI